MNAILESNLVRFINQDFFSKKLIDNIPGVFYVYKQCHGVFRLFTCNNQHLKVTGYSAEESFNQEPFFFVDQGSIDAIAKGLGKIESQNYVKQVYANFLTKEKEIVPYVFEGYGFMYENTNYFMGVGTDISDLTQAHAALNNERLQREKNEKELLALTLKDKQKEDMLASISRKLDFMLLNSEDKEIAKKISDLTKEINATFLFSDENWQQFELLFNNLHQNFYKNLLEKHPNLTKSEQNYCALIKLYMNGEQICNTLNISKEGLKKKKYRLKQKLSLKYGQSLEVYMSQF